MDVEHDGTHSKISSRWFGPRLQENHHAVLPGRLLRDPFDQRVFNKPLEPKRAESDRSESRVLIEVPETE